MPPFENAQNNIIASKDRAEAMSGLRDVLQADAQFSRGEIGLGETLRREGSGIARVVSGSIGNLFRSRSTDDGNAGGVLPGLEISEREDSLSQSMGSEDNIRQLKKEAAAYQQNQSPEMDSDGGAVRQAKKEKASYLETQSLGFEYQ